MSAVIQRFGGAILADAEGWAARWTIIAALRWGALHELGVQMIPAYSPEAPGRSERNFGTWQGRLPQAAAAPDLDPGAANQFLREHYVAQFNHRFPVSPKQRGNAFGRCRSRAPDPDGFGDFCGG
jgi:hypothetical protein